MPSLSQLWTVRQPPPRIDSFLTPSPTGQSSRNVPRGSESTEQYDTDDSSPVEFGPVNQPRADPESYKDKRMRALLFSMDLATELKLPPCPGSKKRGAPSKQDTWLRGVYLALDDVSMGKIKMPPRHLLCATPHKAFVESLPKFTEQTVRKHFSSFEQDGQESEAEEFTSPPVTNNKRRKLRKFYELHEMELFEDMRLIHQGKSFNAMCDIAKRQLPSIFLGRTKNDTFKRFPEQIAKAAAKDEAAKKTSAARERAAISKKLLPDDHDLSSESGRPKWRRSSPKTSRPRPKVVQTTKWCRQLSSWASQWSYGTNTLRVFLLHAPLLFRSSSRTFVPMAAAIFFTASKPRCL